MILTIISIIIYALFGLVGTFLLKKIPFVKKNFSSQKSAIFLSIYFLVLGFVLGGYDPGNTGFAYQVGFGIGNYISCFVGAIIATLFATRFKFSFNDTSFYYALFGSITLGTVLLLLGEV